MERLDGGLLHRPVHPLGLSVGPGMVGLGELVLDAVLIADAVEGMDHPVPLAGSATGEGDAVVGQHLARHGITPSMSRKGDCLDNAPMESFFGSRKNELVHRTTFPTREAARRAIFAYVEAFYNRRCRHSGLGFLTPAQAYQQMARAA